MCAAKYEQDGLWYRAEILQVGVGDSRTHLVLFVDFGNIETCAASDLRKAVCCVDIPVLSHTCYLADIFPVSIHNSLSVYINRYSYRRNLGKPTSLLYSVRGLERSELGGSHGPRAPLGPIFMTGLPER